MDTVKVSVIIPFFNGIDYLEECVRSVCAQTLRELEIILVDDGSTDGCSALADKLAQKDARIRVIHQQNKGLSGARNSGIDAARGEYIGFVDGDDLVDPSMYEKLYNTAADTGSEVVTCAYRSFNENGTLSICVPHFPIGEVLDKAQIQTLMPQLVKDGSLMFVWRRLYSAALFHEKGIRFDENIRICEDASFCMECLLRAERVSALDDVLYAYRFVSGSLIRSRKYKPAMTDSLLRQYETKRQLIDLYCPNKDDVNKANAEYTFRHISQLLFGNLYRRKEHRFGEFRRIARSPLFQDMYRRFDIQAQRSRSLDWVMIRLIQLHLSLPAYWIGTMIYGKEK